MKSIKAILFDSGRVLNRPVTGNWFITPNFWQYVDKKAFDRINKSRIITAFCKADEYIVSQKLITTTEDEYTHFVKFYTIFSQELPELNLNKNAIRQIVNDLVYNTEKYVFYDDALQVIPKLSKKYKLAIVSDAWPSLLDVYRKTGLDAYFSQIVISSILGTSKPDKEMYLTPLRALHIEPGEAIFIDDSIINCLGAAELGIETFLLVRQKRYYIVKKIKSIGKGYTVIQSLKQIEKFL